MMLHLNSNLLCVVTAFYTGPDIYKDDLIQLCVVPVDHNFDVSKDIPIFTANIKQVNYGVDRDFIGQKSNKVDSIAGLGQEMCDVLDNFDMWFDGLQLKHGKKIMPLSYNYPLIRDFLIRHMEVDIYNQYFTQDYRDLLPAALFCNDRSWFHSEDYAFNKVKLSYMGSTLNIPAPASADIFAQADAILKIYKTMMTMYLS